MKASFESPSTITVGVADNLSVAQVRGNMVRAAAPPTSAPFPTDV